MYGFSVDVDLSFFHKQRLIQICFGSNDLQLNFDERISVSVTSFIRFTDASGQPSETEDFKEAASLLVTLLDQTVRSARGDEDGTLDLLFDGGATLTVFDNQEHYESYVITYGEKQIVV